MRWASGCAESESLYECEQFRGMLRQLYWRPEPTTRELHWPSPGNHQQIQHSYPAVQHIPYQSVQAWSRNDVPSWRKGPGRRLYENGGGLDETELMSPLLTTSVTQLVRSEYKLLVRCKFSTLLANRYWPLAWFLSTVFPARKRKDGRMTPR